MFVDFGKKRRQPLTHDLRNALEAVLERGPIKQVETQAVGCFIPYDR
jgi:hypothetical protein